MIALNSIILTPSGYRYPFNMRPGTQVWTYQHDRYVTEPFDPDFGNTAFTSEITRERLRYTDWHGDEVPSGSDRDHFVMVNHDVLTVGGWRSLSRLAGEALPRVPYHLLAVRPRRPNPWRTDRGERFARRVGNPPGIRAPDLTVTAVGPTDSVVEFGTQPRAYARPTINHTSAIRVRNSNLVVNGLIIKGDLEQ